MKVLNAMEQEFFFLLLYIYDQINEDILRISYEISKVNNPKLDRKRR